MNSVLHFPEHSLPLPHLLLTPHAHNHAWGILFFKGEEEQVSVDVLSVGRCGDVMWGRRVRVCVYLCEGKFQESTTQLAALSLFVALIFGGTCMCVRRFHQRGRYTGANDPRYTCLCYFFIPNGAPTQ